MSSSSAVLLVSAQVEKKHCGRKPDQTTVEIPGRSQLVQLLVSVCTCTRAVLYSSTFFKGST